MPGWILTYHLDFVFFVLLNCGVLWFADHRALRPKASRNARLRILCGVLFLSFMGCIAAHWTGIVQKSRLQMTIEGYAPTYAKKLEDAGHQFVFETASGDDPHFLRLIERQKKWQQANGFINDIYTMRRDASGQVRIVVDSETDYNGDGIFSGDKEQRTAPGELYTEVTSDMLHAFEGTTVFDGNPEQDRWGIWVSAYAPLHDSSG